MNMNMNMNIAQHYKKIRALSPNALNSAIKTNLEASCAASNFIYLLLRGRTAQVISDFNDQQFGRSKKSLNGKRFTIENAMVDGGTVTVWLKGCRCGAELWKDVEVI
jgi:hypothetical protein